MTILIDDMTNFFSANRMQLSHQTQDFENCPKHQISRISPFVSISIGCISLMATVSVLISLTYKKKIFVLNSKQSVFTKLLHFSIFALLFNDLIVEIAIIPSNIIQIVFFGYENAGKTFLTILWIFSQITESFVIASGIWGFIITFCIYLYLKFFLITF